jgi:hypothetical protein
MFSGAHSTVTLRDNSMTPACAEGIADGDKLPRTAQGLCS